MDKALKSEITSLKKELTTGIKGLEKLVIAVNNRIEQLEIECEITPYPQDIRDILSSESNIIKEFYSEDVNIIKCKEDPVYFIQQCEIEHPIHGKIKFEPYEYQKKLIDCYWTNQSVFAKMPRQSGRTICSVLFLLWYAMYNDKVNVVIASDKNSHINDIINKIKFTHENLPVGLKVTANFSKSKIIFNNGSKIEIVSTNDIKILNLNISLLFVDNIDSALNIAKEFNHNKMNLVDNIDRVIITSTPGCEFIIDQFVEFISYYSDMPSRDEDWANKQIDKIGMNTFRKEYGERYDPTLSQKLESILLILDHIDLISIKYDDSRLSDFYQKVRALIYDYIKNYYSMDQFVFELQRLTENNLVPEIKIDDTKDQIYSEQIKKCYDILFKHSYEKLPDDEPNSEPPTDEELIAARKWVKASDDAAKKLDQNYEKFVSKTTSFVDTVSDKELMNKFKDACNFEEDFFYDFTNNWNKSKRSRIESLTDVLNLFCLDIKKHSGEIIKVNDTKSAEAALSAFITFENNKQKINEYCVKCKEELLKIMLNDSDFDFSLYYHELNNFLSKIKSFINTSSSDPHLAIYQKFFHLLVSMIDQQELEMFKSPKTVNSVTFESNDVFEGENLKKYQHKQLSIYKNQLKRAYEYDNLLTDSDNQIG